MPAIEEAQAAPEDSDSGDDLQEAAFFGRGCCCFWSFPCFQSRESNNWERIWTSEKEEENIIGHWWDKGANVLKKVREWSELVAGPKWKTFIRRFNRTAGRARPAKFQYDPLSYALNFDDGPGQNGQFEDDRVFRDFSSRYAPSKVSMDMGKDAPSFT
ncbi:hypothetical protein F511_15730 [Dorcoceras hygrometricum]|uniref:NHL domain-containing protein n=1 Tax=Dorcoceras hygrometricum TaxID=472368 RepID=A0A2Z7D8C2_9LAMI|nr:hypothetical protein F511_15730 [Dorcoceras hygrometricum]